MVKASFMRRLAAFIVDTVFVNMFFFGGLTMLIDLKKETVIAGNVLLFLVFFILFYLYQVVAPAFMDGKTIGKGLFGIRVVKLDGKPVTHGTMLLREIFGKFFSSILYIGFLLALGDERRTLHDRLAKTIVIKEQDKGVTF